ncbi:MAG: type II toxin-antitoxin system RelE/ParE family toxin [Nitrospinae bacterium]|nr:type II toxin-antitoxin system RelE/ParE family toxin [Nitrospinota bacterium]
MAIVKLTPAADLDLLEIWNFSDDRWGPEQADTYLRKLDARMTFLAKNPKRGRPRRELPGHPMSFHEGRHIIFGSSNELVGKCTPIISIILALPIRSIASF